MSSYQQENRQRLINLLSNIESAESPMGWRKVSSLSVGGLLAVGFSKQKKHLLLVISGSGRSIVDCRSGNKIARDYEEDEGLDMVGLTCLGIGPIENEVVGICGISGGGLPHSNHANETLAVVSRNWPEQDLIFCPAYKHPLTEGNQTGCTKVYSEHIRAFGFSWCGNFFIAACSSGIDIWQRQVEV